MIKFNCPQCGYGMKVPDSAAGKRGACHNCKGRLSVPNRNTMPSSGNIPSYFAPLLNKDDSAVTKDGRDRDTSTEQFQVENAALKMSNGSQVPKPENKHQSLLFYLSALKLIVSITAIIAGIGGLAVLALTDGSPSQPGISFGLGLTVVATWIAAAIVWLATLAAVEFIKVVIDTENHARQIAAKL